MFVVLTAIPNPEAQDRAPRARVLINLAHVHMINPNPGSGSQISFDMEPTGRSIVVAETVDEIAAMVNAPSVRQAQHDAIPDVFRG